MKKILIGIIIGVILTSFICVGTGLIDFSKYTDEELFKIEIDLQAEKISRKIAKSATINPGKYIVGEDIPAGTYSVTTVGGGNSDYLYVYNSSGKKIASYMVGKWHSSFDVQPIGKLVLEDGYTIKWEVAKLEFTVYSGGIVFS